MNRLRPFFVRSCIRLSVNHLLAIMLLGSITSLAQAQSPWPAWRGPHGNGTAAEGTYPTSWNENNGVAWKVALPGRGASTPIILDDKVYVTLGHDGQNALMCVDNQGKVAWEKKFGKEKPGKNAKASGSNSSPATDGKHIYVYFKSGDFACVTPSGDVVWSLNIQEKYGEDSLWWDLGTSPVLTENTVVIAVMQTGPSFLVALDKSTGKEVWKADRWLDVREEANQSYTTPSLAKLKEGEALITLGADHVTAHAVTDGKLLWKLGGFNPKNDGFFRSISSPVVHGDLAFCPYARGSSLTAVRTSSGLTDDQRVVWKNDFGSDVPTPVYCHDKLYLLGDKGLVSCLNPQTGETLWSLQLPKSNRQYSSSPIMANDKLYCVREDAMTFVVEEDSSGKSAKVVSENKLLGDAVATPVFANQRIYLRTFDALYCLK